MSVPVFLHGYEPFAALELWRHGGSVDDPKHRQWMIEVNERKMFVCELLWHDEHMKRQVYVVQYAESIPEAVYLSLDAFKKNQKTIDDPNGSPR